MNRSVHRGRFAQLNRLLREAGSGTPRLLIDLDSLDDNILHLKSICPPEQLRLVAKSLPSMGLLEYISQRLWGDRQPRRLMVFHLPFLQQLSREYPDTDLLLGKPLPLSAMAEHANPGSTRLQWLADDPRRLQQIIELASDRGERLGVSLELDIGMHRGGANGVDGMRSMLDLMRQHAGQVELRGFMGYDAHAGKAPPPRSAREACARAATAYRRLVDLARDEYPELEERPWCINGAGSPTVALHGPESPLNDFSIGSALLKPSGFDLPQLDGFETAALIAAPVLKRLPGIRIPFLEKLPAWRRDSLFIYGGRWMATPYSPGSLKTSALYGLSSNQQLFTIPASQALEVDDYVFLRPDQSEAVLLQFGDLLAVRGEEVVAEWPVLRNELDTPLTEVQDHSGADQ